MTDDERHLRRALALAIRGRGAVEPNPMVGAAVVAANEVIGEGWHQQFGGPHAEIHALAEAGDRARGGTLYVTLEPCCHFGKTPPCADAVIAAGVRRVVAAMADPYPKVAGGGLARLRAAGVEVEVGLCEPEAVAINAPYLKLLHTGRPWVHAKWAMTLDGRIATRTGDSKWISGDESRRRVHKLRGRMDAILVGRGTVIADDPQLTARPPGPRVPARVVVSSSGELPDRCQLLATIDQAPVIVYSSSPVPAWTAAGAEVVSDTGMSLDAVLADLGRRRMTNVLVEGGGRLLGSTFDAGLVDEVHTFIAPLVVGGADAHSPVGGTGVERLTQALRLTDPTTERLGDDVYLSGRVRREAP